MLATLAWLVSASLAIVPLPARADVALAIGGALASGDHTSLDGTLAGRGRPVPLVDLDATIGALGLHAESIPYVVTAAYGDPAAPSSSRISTADAVLRAFVPNRNFGFGFGYGILRTTVDRRAPSGSLDLATTGFRIEAFERVRLSAHASLEMTLGGMPDATGTLVTRVGVPGAVSPRDRVLGSQVDATLRAVDGRRGPLSFAYGIRYRNATYTFAASSALVEHDRALLPFAELRVRL